MRVAGSLALIAVGLGLATGAAWPRSEGGARLYVRPKPAVWGLWFNPDSPVFHHNPQLVRAINYALDRPALIRAWGRYAGHPTARLMPPGLRGYGERSPYPLNGPDVDFARALADGNLRGGAATIGVYRGFLSGVAAEVKRELAAIDLNVNVTLIAGVCSRACPQPDMFIGGWGSDYPDPVSALWPYSHPDYATLPTLLSSPWKERLAQAAGLGGEARAQAFAQLDYDVMKLDPPIAPFMAANAAMLVSARTHCFHWNESYGVDLGALCVR
jgi:ABC-type transport system substrate-binding protein